MTVNGSFKNDMNIERNIAGGIFPCVENTMFDIIHIYKSEKMKLEKSGYTFSGSRIPEKWLMKKIVQRNLFVTHLF